MKPFVLLATRDDDVLADEEYEAVARFGGLKTSQAGTHPPGAGELPHWTWTVTAGSIVGRLTVQLLGPAERKSRVQEAAGGVLDQRPVDEVVARELPVPEGACYGVGDPGPHRCRGDRTRPGGGGPVASDPRRRRGRRIRSSRTCPGSSAPTWGGGAGDAAQCRLLAEGIGVPGADVPASRRTSTPRSLHPELDAQGLVNRIRVYKDLGYFKPDELETVIERITHGPAVDQAPRCSARSWSAARC
ncbi:glutamine amidotransferase [Kocuria rhizophila]|nr:glutamine amidotransferase [Kocuria rhizophila]